MRVQTGIDVLLADRPDLLRHRRIGLATNPTGVTADLTSTVDALLAYPSVKLVALFGPEHGLRAGVQDGLAVASGIDRGSGLPVYSLYGDTKKPAPEMMKGIDLLIFDMQDVGCRFYTYLYTMSYLMEAAAECGVAMLVLDRPNPLAGLALEGSLLDPRFSSFIGRYPIPVRYGLTVGELAQYLNSAFHINADLRVIRMQRWQRSMWFDETGLPWVPPSPNMPTLDTATVYPGMCLVEGTNLSEGRGSTKPFEMIGAPWIDGQALARALNALNLAGVRFRPADFVPTFSKFSGEWCAGIQVHVTDRLALRPVQTGLHVLATIKSMYPQHFSWLATSWEGEPPHFDLLMGGDLTRRRLDNGDSVDDIVCEWENQTLAFAETIAPYLLYK
jgi:uncharacterized protein YbbC (DUF1343 family)